eukprot:TRINITY_DN1617_c0_g1_i1.p1 TRINITY_DN1617_c0_g1~~TRINITY_DN1617_c0_g1_i1.p1  ORF type:complete len:588 (-),score=111.00 TRINITY_DN1617_c0_g1_i1:1155-2918(-)
MKKTESKIIPVYRGEAINFVKRVLPFDDMFSVVAYQMETSIGLFNHQTGEMIMLDRFPFCGDMCVSGEYLVLWSDKALGVYKVRVVEGEALWEFDSVEIGAGFALRVDEDRMIVRQMDKVFVFQLGDLSVAEEMCIGGEHFTVPSEVELLGDKMVFYGWDFDLDEFKYFIFTISGEYVAEGEFPDGYSKVLKTDDYVLFLSEDYITSVSLEDNTIIKTEINCMPTTYTIHNNILFYSDIQTEIYFYLPKTGFVTRVSENKEDFSQLERMASKNLSLHLYPKADPLYIVAMNLFSITIYHTSTRNAEPLFRMMTEQSIVSGGVYDDKVMYVTKQDGVFKSHSLDVKLRTLHKWTKKMKGSPINYSKPIPSKNIFKDIIKGREKTGDKYIAKKLGMIEKYILRDYSFLLSTNESCTITDPETYDDPIIYINETFCEMTQYSSREILGKNCRFLQGKYSDRGTVHNIRYCLDHGKSLDVSLLNYRKDGTPFWNIFQIYPIRNNKNKVISYLAVQKDSTLIKLKGKDIESFDSVELALWLDLQGLGYYGNEVIEKGITGQLLLSDENYLRDDLNYTAFDEQKLIKCLGTPS